MEKEQLQAEIQLRQKRLVRYLVNAEGGCTRQELMQQQGCSLPTLLHDIEKINQYASMQIQVLSQEGNVILFYHSEEAVKRFLGEEYF